MQFINAKISTGMCLFVFYCTDSQHWSIIFLIEYSRSGSNELSNSFNLLPRMISRRHEIKMLFNAFYRLFSHFEETNIIPTNQIIISINFVIRLNF